MARGRRPTGPTIVQTLEGAQEAKDRVVCMLQTLTGALTVPEACARLGIEQAHFFRLRDRALQAAVDELAPKPLGRPSQYADPENARIAELEAELRQMRIELVVSQTREELAITMPHVLKPRVIDVKKKRPRKRKR